MSSIKELRELVLGEGDIRRRHIFKSIAERHVSFMQRLSII